MPLQLVIDNTSPDDIDHRRECSASDFIQAALHTARSSVGKTRQAILADVSVLLDCQPEDLSFLFYSETLAQPQYKLDLPDYRLRASEVYLEAAE